MVYQSGHAVPSPSVAACMFSHTLRHPMSCLLLRTLQLHSQFAAAVLLLLPPLLLLLWPVVHQRSARRLVLHGCPAGTSCQLQLPQTAATCTTRRWHIGCRTC